LIPSDTFPLFPLIAPPPLSPSQPILTTTLPSSPYDENDPEAHRNEGFLKSLWHNLTNHPAHQQKPDGSDDSESGKKPGDGEGNKPGSS
jgi:hypothetical protein